MGFFEDNFNELDALQNKKAKEKKQYFAHIACNDLYYRDLFIPESFSKIVLIHVVSLYLANNNYYTPPMYLAIEGLPGEGKTAQTIGTCIQHGIDVLYISASQLSGSHERDSLDIMDDVYNKALEWKTKGRTVAIVIDDFHLGNAIDDDNIKRTINSALLTGFLMNLADDNTVGKVPIVLTGNDYSKVYAPLLRSGRADRFEWVPSYKEKKEIVEHLLRPFVNINCEDFEMFFDKYSYASVADFAQLKNEYRKKILFECIASCSCFDSKAILEIQRKVEKRSLKTSFNELEELALKRMKKREGDVSND